jgi:proline iminopeptidase
MALGTRVKLFCIVSALLGAYLAWVRPRLLRWGSTDEEFRGSFPGDIIPAGTRSGTMATTINASPSALWPWLVQMGTNRAGWYS